MTGLNVFDVGICPRSTIAIAKRQRCAAYPGGLGLYVRNEQVRCPDRDDSTCEYDAPQHCNCKKQF